MKLFKNIIIPLIIGTIIGLLAGLNNNYNNFIKPDIMPPNYIFPIVWTVLYILMGISNYLVNKKNYQSIYYIIQLIFNFIWPILFFSFKLYFLSIIWIILLLAFVILMIIDFYKYNKLSSYLQIPYILWLIFATILSIKVFNLN